MLDILNIFHIVWSKIGAKGRIAFFASFFLFLLAIVFRMATPFYFAYIIIIMQKGDAFAISFVVGGYGLMFFGMRVVAELNFGAYVYFEQVLQKSFHSHIINTFYYIPFKELSKQETSEHSIIVDRGTAGLRDIFYGLFFLYYRQ